MVSIKYLEEVISPIIKKFRSEEMSDDFNSALQAYKSKNDDAFQHEHSMYNGCPDVFIEDTFKDLISNIVIVIEKDTILNIGEDNTELATLEEVVGDKLYFYLTDLYEDDAYKEEFLSINAKGNIEISADYDNGEISDAISDNIGYCVDSVIYSINVK